ncbi:MAG: PH domain-containing protein [Roseiflexaceae bacterium]|nr:PH domain-containing protein [Roseiflexaceae bacterium]
MAYIDDLLARGERIRYIGRQHSFVLVSNIITEMVLIGLLIAAGIVSRAAFEQRSIAGQPIGIMIMAACAVISLLVLVSAVLDFYRWNNEQYAVTDQRVIHVRGIFNKAVSDSSLEKINDVTLNQSWIGRIFDFGDLEVITGSDIGANYMRKIAHPIEFKKAMIEAKQHYSRGFGYLDPQPVAAYVGVGADQNPQRAHSVEDTLKSLTDLRDLGLLSADEYEKKKQELMNRS